MAGSSYSVVGRRAGSSRAARTHPTNDVGEPARSTPPAGRTVNPYCLLKEQLRAIYHAATINDALKLPDGWLQWARRCRLEPFVKLARRITEQRSRIEATLTESPSNARVEQVNTEIRLIIRRGFGYRSPEAVTALAMLSLGGFCPPLRGR